MGFVGQSWHVVTAKWVLVSLAFGLLPPAPVQIAEAASIESISPGFDPTMPPQYDLATIAGQGQLFQTCNTALANAVSQSIEALGTLAKDMSDDDVDSGVVMPKKVGFGMNAVCTGTDVGPSADSLECKSIKKADGTISKSALDAKMAAIQSAMDTIQCKKDKFKAVESELNCLTTQADMLNQQISSIQGAYQTNTQRMQQDVVKINQVLTDRMSQRSDVAQRLTGQGVDAEGKPIPGNGSKGLLAVRDGLCMALTGSSCGSTGGASGSRGGGPGAGSGLLSGQPDQSAIPGQIQTLKNQMTDVQNMQTALVEETNLRTMGLAGECFNTRVVPQFKCVKNGDPVSVREYIKCMYREKLGVNDSGMVERSSQVNGGIQANQHRSKAASLDSVLDSIMADMPQRTPTTPTTPGAVPDLSNVRAATILTAADVSAQYGSTLETYDTPKIKISEFVKKNVEACFKRAQNVVTQEKNMVSSPLGQKQTQIAKAQDDLKVNAAQMLSANTMKFEEAMTALTGMNMPLSTVKCNGAAPNVQIACLQDLQRNMEALLHGNEKQSAVVMSLKGTDPNTTITFNCQGLNGCIAALQNVDRNLQAEMKRVVAFKQQYVMAAKQNYDNFTKQMGAMMSSQGQALNGRLKMINMALSSLGVSAGINIDNVQCEEPQFDQDGLPLPPQSAVKLIGCRMNPPMKDVSGSDFSNATASMGDAMSALSEKSAPLNEAKNKLLSLKSSCVNDAVAAKLASAQTTADLIASGNCQYAENFCSGSSQIGKLSTAMGDIDGVELDEDAIRNITAALDAGMEACSSPDAQKARWVSNNCKGEPPEGVPSMEDAKYATDADRQAACKAYAPSGVSPPSGTCNQIATRLKRDISAVGRVASSGSAGDAKGD